MPRSPWSIAKEQAVGLVAEDKLIDEEIAKQVGIERRTLTRWKNEPEFAGRVRKVREAYRDAVLSRGIADRVKRIDSQNDRWKRMLRLLDARAADPNMASVPGGDTGLLLRRVKAIGVGRHQRVVMEYETDTGLLKELRAIEERADMEVTESLALADSSSNAPELPLIETGVVTLAGEKSSDCFPAKPDSAVPKPVLPDSLDQSGAVKVRH